MNDIKPVTPKWFTVRISDVGTDTFNSSYKKWKEKSALVLLRQIMLHCAMDMVGKEHAKNLINFTCIDLLNDIRNDMDKRFPEIKKEDYEDLKNMFILINIDSKEESK